MVGQDGQRFRLEEQVIVIVQVRILERQEVIQLLQVEEEGDQEDQGWAVDYQLRPKNEEEAHEVRAFDQDFPKHAKESEDQHEGGHSDEQVGCSPDYHSRIEQDYLNWHRPQGHQQAVQPQS